MPRQILYFTEYTGVDDDGKETSPYIENDKWVWNGKNYTLKEIGEICKLDDSELVMLRIRYGCD